MQFEGGSAVLGGLMGCCRMPGKPHGFGNSLEVLGGIRVWLVCWVQLEWWSAVFGRKWFSFLYFFIFFIYVDEYSVI